ncbi:MAG: hypothetical protein ACOYD4_05770 [Solirubrobacterales bacterium]
MIAAALELLVEGIGRVLGVFGFEKLIERDEAKPDPRNFKPPR